MVSLLEPATDSLLSLAADGEGEIEGRIPAEIGGHRIRLPWVSQIAVMPATPYTQEILEAWRAGNLVIIDPRAEKAVRTAMLPRDGHFRFARMPDGEFFVYTWAEATKSASISFRDVILFDRVSVRAGVPASPQMRFLVEP
jgi:hypothetical protein